MFGIYCRMLSYILRGRGRSAHNLLRRIRRIGCAPRSADKASWFWERVVWFHRQVYGAKMTPRSNLYSASLPEIPSAVTFATKNAKLTPEPLFGLALIFSALLEAVETAISGQCNIWLKTLPRLELYLCRRDRVLLPVTLCLSV